MKGEKAERIRQELDEAKARGVSMLSTYLRLTITALLVSRQFDEQERALVRELRDQLNLLSLEPVREDEELIALLAAWSKASNGARNDFVVSWREEIFARLEKLAAPAPPG
jgi:hypothetical protein